MSTRLVNGEILGDISAEGSLNLIGSLILAVAPSSDQLKGLGSDFEDDLWYNW